MRADPPQPFPGGVRFLARCAALTCAFLAAWVLTPDAWIHALNRLDAILAASLLGCFGMCPRVSGLIVSIDGAAVFLARECSSLLLAAPFCAILAAGARSHDLMTYVHSFAGQIGTVLLVLAACLAWLSWTGAFPRAGSAVRFAGRVLAAVTALAVAWFAFAGQYAVAIVTLASAWLSALGLQAPVPDMALVGPGAVNAFGLLLLCALVLASPGMGVYRRLLAMATGTGVLTLLLVAQETAEALVFGAGPVRTPWWLPLSAALQQAPVPVVLWLFLGGRMSADHSPSPQSDGIGLVPNVPVMLDQRAKP